MSPRRTLMSLLLVLPLLLPAKAPAQRLPSPQALGSECGLITSCPWTGPLAAHVQFGGDFWITAEGLQPLLWTGLDFSGWHWFEGGARYGVRLNAGDHFADHHPLTLWFRFTPQLPDRALSVGAEVRTESTVVDSATFFADAQFYTLSVGHEWKYVRLYGLGSYVEAGRRSYRELQGGGGIEVRIPKIGLALIGEALGQVPEDARRPASVTYAVAVRIWDETGIGFTGGYQGSRDAHSAAGIPPQAIAAHFRLSFGPEYKRPPRNGPSLFDQWQAALSDAILASWQARQAAAMAQELAQHSAWERAARPYWLPGAALEPPPPAECTPVWRSFRCAQVAGWHEAADLVKGTIHGTLESLPGANLMKLKPPGSYWFEVGRGAAQIATGVVETGGGAVGAAGGSGASGTGAGALVGVPVVAGSVALGTSGVRAFGQGVERLVQNARKRDDGGGSAPAPSPTTSPAPAPPKPPPAPPRPDAATGAPPLRDRQGGTYFLKDRQTKQVMRNGRTVDLQQRRGQHANDSATGHLDFEIDVKTNDYAEQRGIEQLHHEKYQPPMNKINAISRDNPRRQEYLDAGKKKLQTEGKWP